MAFQPIILRPGTDTQRTPLLNEAAWSATDLIRFDTATGLIEKLGGWQHVNEQTFDGVARAILAWADLAGSLYIAVGTNTNLQVLLGSTMHDITPIRATANVSGAFSTTNGSNVVSIQDVAHGAEEGDTVIILTYVAVGGIVLQGEYEITSIIDADNYEIEAASNATATVSGGGDTSVFDTTFGSNDVEVTLPNHGFIAGDVYIVHVSTAVGGFNIFGEYLVQSVLDADTFVITLSGGATSTATASENSGDARLQYLLSPGLASSLAGGGYGEGGWGLGPYGEGSPTGLTIPLRQWSLDAWGQILLASPTGLGIFQWDPSSGIIDNPATQITAAPDYNTGFFIAMPQRQVVAYGCEDPGTGQQDPLLVRYCDIDDFDVWTATSTNQAGSFRIPRGSRIVGGMQGPQFGLLWTDLALWAQQYVGPPFVYGWNEIGTGCGLISKRACGTLGSIVYWMSLQGFFIYNGQGVEALPCPIWDIIFKNLNSFQSDKIHCAPNSSFNEVAWHFPSASGSGEDDMYVKYNSVTRTWDYGNMVRTAWTDQSVYGPPMGTDTDGYIQQHETSVDADGEPMESSATTGWFKLSGGEDFIFVERIIPDFKLSSGATINVSIEVSDYPWNTPEIFGPYAVDSSTEYVIIRARGRLARIQISSDDLGSSWRFGSPLFSIEQSGRR